MKLKLALLIASLAALVVSVAYAVYEDWPYRVSATIDNQTGVIPTDQWVRMESFPALNLITGEYMLADAGDVRMVDPVGADLPLFAQSLGSATATWWFEVQSLPLDASTYYLHMGKTGETRDQALGLTGTDVALVPDDASLDITTLLSMESLGTTLEEIPTAETWLVNKNQAYGIGVRTGNEVFAYIESNASTASETLVPNAAGDETNIGTLVGCAVNFQCVDDPVGAPDDAATTETDGGGAEVFDSYNLVDSAVAGSEIVTSVTVNFRWTDFNVDGITTCVRPSLRLATVNTAGTQLCVDDGAGYRDNSELLARPGGGTWTAADLDDLQVRVGIDAIGGAPQGNLTQIYVTIAYQPRVTASFSPIAVDTSYDFQATYDGANLRLFVDDVLCTPACAGITATAITVDVSTNDIDIGPFSGLVERTLVQDAATTFTDSSASGADIAANAQAVTAIIDTDFDQFGNKLNFYNNGTAFGPGSPAAIDNIFDGGGTLEFCARPSDVAGGDGLLSKSGAGQGWVVDMLANGRLTFFHEFTGTDGFWFTPVAIVVDDQWHCYAIAWDADAAANIPLFYEDGAVTTTTAGPQAVGVRVADGPRVVTIGDVNGAQALTGDMADIRMWDDIRTPAEILANWDAQLTAPGAEANLVAYWQFAESKALDYTYEPNTVDETAVGIAATTAVLTADAAAVQKDVAVPAGELFEAGQDVTISDDTPDTETNVIASISGDTLTMVTNLANAYTTGQNAQVVGEAWEWKGTIADQSDDTNDGTYQFNRNMVNLDSFQGPLVVKAFEIDEFVQPTPISNVQLPLDPEFSPTITGEGIPFFGAIVSAYSQATELNMNLLWIVGFHVLAFGVLVAIYQHSKEPIVALAACGIILAMGPALGVYSWFVLIAYLIIAVSASVAVGRTR